MPVPVHCFNISAVYIFSVSRSNTNIITDGDCSYLVCDTQMAWLTPASENLRTLLVMIELASANPNNEWSVNTALIPIVRACSIDSWASVENAYTHKPSHAFSCYTPAYLSKLRQVRCGPQGRLLELLWQVFSARQHAEHAICYRPSVRPSHGWISQKRLNVSSKFFHRLIGPTF